MEKQNHQYLKWVSSKSLLNNDLIHDIKTVDLSYFQCRKVLGFEKSNTKLRLGKMVERFFSHALKSSDQFQVLEENFQIIKDGITLGEIDFILKDNLKDETIHLELVHKFYLFHPTNSISEPKHFVGPNLKDSLDQKLEKLREKQFPLLLHPFCQEVLKNRGIKTRGVQQKLLFTGSIYLPLEKSESLPAFINKSCVDGYWMNLKDLKNGEQEGDSYYLPRKEDWLSEPHQIKDWAKNNDFWEKLKTELKNKYSPMVWKKSKGVFSSLFVVWWK